MKISPITGQTLFLGLLILVSGVICEGEVQEVTKSPPKSFECSHDVLRSYMLKGRPFSTPDPMLLCPDIKSNCCTKIDIQHIYHAVTDILPARFAEYQSKVKMVLSRLRKLHNHILKARPVITGNAKRRLFCNKQTKKVYDFPLEDLYRKATEELELLGDDSLEHYQKFFCVLCDGENHPFMEYTAKTPQLIMDIDFCEEFLTKRKEVLKILNVDLVRYLVALQHMVDCTHYVSSYNLDFFNQPKLLLAAQTDKCLDYLGTRGFQTNCEKVCQKINFSKVTYIVDGDYEFLNDAVSLFEKYLDYKETGNFISTKLRAFFKGLSLPRELDQNKNILSAEAADSKALDDDNSHNLKTPVDKEKTTNKKKKSKRNLKTKNKTVKTAHESKKHLKVKTLDKGTEKPVKKQSKAEKKIAKRKLNKKSQTKSASKSQKEIRTLKNKGVKKSSKTKKVASENKANKNRKLTSLAEKPKATQLQLLPDTKQESPVENSQTIFDFKSAKSNSKSDHIPDQHASLNKERILQSFTPTRQLPDSSAVTSTEPPQNPPSNQKAPLAKKPKVTAKLQFDPELVRFYEEIMVTTQDGKPEEVTNIFKIQTKPIDFDHPKKKFEKENGVNPEKYAKLNFDVPKEQFYKELFTYRDSDVVDPNLAYFLVDFTPDFLKQLRIDLRENFKINPHNFVITPPKKKSSQRILLDEWTGSSDNFPLHNSTVTDSLKEVV